MRIIAGTLKGRRLKAPTWEGLRPTSDKLRETLFNVLAGCTAGARWLDGFAGTGAVGIEALSRGAAHVQFIERDRRAVALIRENLAGCAVTAGYTIEQADVATALSRLPAETRFDVIVLDPPYDVTELGAVLDAAGGRLEQGGVIVLERATRTDPEVPASLRRMRDIRSGDSTLTLLRRVEGEP
ncbi:MAG: 16S rRNA (guanine(966)-N(2))-methyltransferase RsmD [Vicinamibacterales bacterium]